MLLGHLISIYAVVVTMAFGYSRLDLARTFSSRLSSSPTILLVSLTVPGWLAHLLSYQSRSLPVAFDA